LSQYTAVNSPTFTTNVGFSGDGTSAYVDTNFNPSISGINYTLDDASRIMYADFPLDSTYPESSGGGNENMSRNAGSILQRINQGLVNVANAPTNWNGNNIFRAINRTSLLNVEMFGNLTQTSTTATSSTISNNTQRVLSGFSAFSSSANIFKIYGMGASLVSENTDLYNALNTYITSI